MTGREPNPPRLIVVSPAEHAQILRDTAERNHWRINEWISTRESDVHILSAEAEHLGTGERYLISIAQMARHAAASSAPLPTIPCDSGTLFDRRSSTL